MRKVWMMGSVVVFLQAVLSLGAANAASADQGKDLFESNCAACHGMTGTSLLPNAPHFAKGERLEKTDEQLCATISGGLNVMPPWKGVMTEQEIREVVVYLRTLAK